MSFEQFIYKKDARAKNLGKLYNLFKRCLNTLQTDLSLTHRAFFPYLADELNLEKHGKALSIKRFKGEDLEVYRGRVANAKEYISWLGTRRAMRDYLDALLGVDEYEILEAPEDAFTVGESVLGNGERIFRGKGVFVMVHKIQEDDRLSVLGYLDENLPPDIIIGVRSE